MSTCELAIRMEEDAIRFYQEAADKTRHIIGKKMFLSIIEDEKRHLDMLGQVVKGFDLDLSCISPMSNIRTVIEEMKDELLQTVTITTDEIEVLKIAMQMEKKSFEFYKKSASEAQAGKEKAFFQALVKEEEEHFTIFENTYSLFTDTKNWFMWDEHSMVDGGTAWA